LELAPTGTEKRPDARPRAPKPGAPAATIFSPLVFTGLIFSAVETGTESGAGIWGYVFLTSGRGLSHEAAGVAVAAYWAMMLVGRAVLGPVAERTGAEPVLGGAVVGVAIGAALMCVPGPGPLAVVGMMVLGLAAAPIFPLLTLTTAQRLGPANATTRVVTVQVAASAIGAAALPAGIGVAIGIISAKALAPALFVLAVAMGGAYAYISALARHGPP
jgi:fucose permease